MPSERAFAIDPSVLEWMRMLKFEVKRRCFAALRRLRGHRPPALDKRHRWLREPPSATDRKACVVACYSGDGTLSRHTLHVARGWHEQGFVVILAVASDHPERVVCDDAWSFLDGLLVRNNSGYDFGSWATVLAARPDLARTSLLALTNDSLYGPLQGFDRMLTRVDASRADIVGVVDSLETRRHFQSFLVFYRPRAMRSRVFRHFWSTIPGAGRDEIVASAEIPHLTRMLLAGLRIDVLFPSRPPVVNPTLRDWRALIDAGFPFVKVHLLKANTHGADITGWNDVMAARGYDPTIVRDHLGRAFEESAAARAMRTPDAPV